MVDILAIGVHPDDVEISCCGTLLHHIALGHKVAVVDLTQGELGTRGSGSLRLQEAQAAADMMQLTARENLGMADGFFRNTEENVLAIVQQIRRFQPKIVLSNAVRDRHPDHGRAAQLINDACFYAGLRKIETTYNGEVQAAHRPQVVYNYIQDYNLEADFVFDITPYMEQKIQVLKCYGSQFFDPNSLEPKTPISGEDFLDFIRAKARSYGRAAGFTFAEGYTVSRNIGVNNLFNIL